MKIPVPAPLVSCLSPWCLGPLSLAFQFRGCHGYRLPGPPSFSPPELARNSQHFKGRQSRPEMMEFAASAELNGDIAFV